MSISLQQKKSSFHINFQAIINDNWGGVVSIVRLSDKIFRPGVILCLESFSYLEVIFI